ncbi:MAG: hypothetical protein ACFFD3_04595 [Candidatus Thorarchaeota archaeon]
MSYTIDLNGRILPVVSDITDTTWLAGAIAGLGLPRYWEPEYLWAPFLSDVLDTADMLLDITPIAPGQTPEDGSVLDSLGGYISITGRVTEQGILFPISSPDASAVQLQLAGVRTVFLGGMIVIPPSEISRFMRLVPLRGPVETQVKEVLKVD